MRDVTPLRTYQCGEYEALNVGVTDLIGPNGELRLFPEVNTGRFFDIDYAKGKLTLRSKGVVGLIPITEKVAIHVRPRAPISNLLYMTWRAGMRPESLPGFIRSYQLATGTVEDPEDLYLHTFLNTLREVDQIGLLRR
jgi:5-methylcytosine-specific restriction enzyme subunit McrC